MLNLAVACLPTFFRDPPDADEGFLGKLVLWARRKIRYERAMSELYRLDDRDLDDIGLARIDFPELAWRHATGAPPLTRPYS